MSKVKRVGVISFARFLAAAAGLAGLATGALYSGVGAIIDLLTIGPNWGTALAFLALIAMPLLFAAFGFFVGAAGAFLYNSTSNWAGKIHLELEE